MFPQVGGGILPTGRPRKTKALSVVFAPKEAAPKSAGYSARLNSRQLEAATARRPTN